MLFWGEQGRRRISIVLALVGYVALTALMIVSALGDGGHLGSGGVRARGVWSDLGTALTLIFMGPFAIWAAIANWNRK